MPVFLLSFFNSSLFKPFLIVTLFISMMGASYIKGYSNAKKSSREGFALEYNSALEKQLKEQKIKQEKEFKERLESGQQKEVIKKVYVDRVVTVEKIVEKSKNDNTALTSENCKMSKEELESFNNLIKNPTKAQKK